MTEEIIICPGCIYGMAYMRDKYACSHPVFKRSGGKIIYPETFKILTKLGCRGMMKK